MIENKNEILSQLISEYNAGFEFKQGRIKDWQDTEDLYFGKVKKSIKNRSSVPVPVMSGFLNTLFSKIDESPALKFVEGEESDYRMIKKVSAMYNSDKRRDDTSWDMVDLACKRMAGFYGRGIIKAYGERSPYKFNLELTDPYNFYVDPLGGGWLENARYLGETGIFKDKSDIEAGVEEGIYDEDEAKKLLTYGNNNSEENVNDDGINSQKVNRFSTLNLSTQHNYSASTLFNLTESGTTYEGKRYYCLWDYERKVLLRCELLKDVFKSELWWWVSFAPYHDDSVFWTMSPADDIRPVAQAIYVLFNQELDNRQKTNWNMMAYDSDIFEGEDLTWRPDGRIMSKKSNVKPLREGIFQFVTPALNGTIDLVSWMDNLIGQKSGVTAAAQGKADDEKVGIYYGNLQQTADRLGLISKYYQNMWKAVGRRYVWSLNQNLDRNTAVRVIGIAGVEWETINRSEVNPDIDVIVESANAQMQLDEVKKKDRRETVAMLQNNPNFAQILNPKWVLEQSLLAAGFTDEEVRQAFDKEWGNQELLSEAAEAIEKIVRNKTVKPNRGANPAYLQKILDYAINNTDNDFGLFVRLMDYIDATVPMVIENMGRQLPIQLQPGLEQGMGGAMPPEQGGMEQIPNTEGGTMARSQDISNMMAATAEAPGMAV